MTQHISWEGRFKAVPQEYALQLQDALSDFLRKANLIYHNMTAIGYDLLEQAQAERIKVLQAPVHCDFADFAVGMPHYHRRTLLWGGMAVRVLWRCHGSYPLPMGTPSPKRLVMASVEYNSTGKVVTLAPPPGESLRYARNDAQDWFGKQLQRQREEQRQQEERELHRRIFGNGAKGWRPGLRVTLSGQVRRHGKTFGPDRRARTDMTIHPQEELAEAAE